MRVVTLRGRVSFWDQCVRGSVVIFFFLRDVVRILCIFSFLSFLDTLFLYMRSQDHLQTYIVLIVFIYVNICFFHLPLYVLFLFSLYTHVSYTCMQSIIFILHKDALMSFVESVSEIQIVKVYLPQTLFLQNFSRVCIMIDFIVFNK